MAKKIDLDGLEHFKQKENASIAGTESSSTASKAYKVGEHFYFKGTLVICTVDIASGGTITLNTNCKVSPLADEVSDLKTALNEQIIISDTEPASENNKIWINSDADSVQVPTMEDIDALNSVFPTETLTNQNVAFVDDGAENVPVKELVVNIDSTQIGGCTEANVTRTGKNLFEPWIATSYGVSYSAQEDGGIHISGTVTDTTWNYMAKYENLSDLGLQVGDTITVSVSGDSDIIFAFACYEDSTKITSIEVMGTSKPSPQTGVIPSNCNRIRIFVYAQASASPTVGTTFNKTIYCQAEKGSTATTFEKYNSTTYNIPFPSEAGSVTEGEIDIPRKKLIVGATEYDLNNVPTIKTLYGINNIWADTGKINTLTYRADIALYIAKVIANE